MQKRIPLATDNFTRLSQTNHLPFKGVAIQVAHQHGVAPLRLAQDHHTIPAELALVLRELDVDAVQKVHQIADRHHAAEALQRVPAHRLLRAQPRRVAQQRPRLVEGGREGCGLARERGGGAEQRHVRVATTQRRAAEKRHV